MANTAHGVIITDRMSGTYDGSDLVSVLFYNGAEETAIDNGNVVLVGDIAEGKEIFKATAVAANTPLNNVAIVANPEVMYGTKKNLSDYFVPAGTPARAYKLRTGRIFSVTAEALSASDTIAKGDIVELAAGTKLKVVKSATTSSTSVGKVIDITVMNGVTYYGIKID